MSKLEDLQDSNHDEETLKRTFNGSKILNIGDIVFTDISRISGYSLSPSFKRELEPCEIKDKEPKVALKYIGEGVFEEMYTHTYIRLISQGLNVFNHLFDNNYDPKTYEIIDYVPSFEVDDKLSKPKQVYQLKNLLKEIKEIPCVINGSRFYSASDEIKRQCLSFRRDEVEDLIAARVDCVNKENKQKIKDILSRIEELETINKEDIEMAYFDNMLYDFGHSNEKIKIK